MKKAYLIGAFCGALLAESMAGPQAQATEAAFGRYIPGIFAVPAAGVVPPEPGLYWQDSSLYYHASAKARLEIPTGRGTTFGLSADYYSTALSAIWVPDLKLGGGLTLAFGATLPLQHLTATGDSARSNQTDRSYGVGDIMLTPMILGWTDGKNFLSAQMRIFAPTGRYNRYSLANIGMNYWTFSPTIAYTRLDMENGLDFSVIAGVDINTANPTTHYKSGAMAHVDMSLTKSIAHGFGAGIFGSVLYQFEDDTGTLIANRLDGFRGRSFAIGPMIKYSGGSKEAPLSASLSWAPEFGTKNRMRGDAVYLNVSGKF